MNDMGTRGAASGIEDWYLAKREHHFFQSRNPGDIKVLEYSQPTGGCRTPAQDSFHLHVPLNCAAELGTGFAGDFGALQSDFCRDLAIRDLALGIRASAQDIRGAPDLDAEEALMRLVSLLVRRAERGFAQRERHDSLAPATRRRVMRHVEGNLAGDCGLLTLAAVAGLSPFHFARAFRHDTGDTPHRYVTRRRVARARNMIVTTDLPLADIAAAVGFSSQSRMTAAFVRQFGLPPGRLRVLSRT